MKRFVEGIDRDQGTMFPERLDDWIGEDNPVRVIDSKGNGYLRALHSGSIDISDLPPGFYIVELPLSDGIGIAGFIKQ